MTADASPRAFAAAGLSARVAPFALTGVLALAIAVPEVTNEHRAWLVLAGVLALAALVMGVAVPWSRVPPWVEVVPPFLYIAAAAALRHAAGGAASGYSALYLVPVLWLALYGTRGQLLAALAVVTIALAAPILIVGEPMYPPSEWRRLVILLGVGMTLGLIVQRLVREVRATAEQADEATREVRAQQAVTDAIITAASDAVVSFDRSATVVSANAEAATMFGRSDLAGQDVFEVLVPEDQRDRLRAGFGRILLAETPDGRDTRFEAALIGPGGSRVPVEIAVARTDGSDGLRIHAFVRDTTERREAERAAKEHRDDLDRLLVMARDLGRSGVDSPSAICVAALELAGADFALLYTIDTDARRLVATGSAGLGAPTDIELDLDRSVAGDVLRSGQATFIGDLDADPRINKAITARVGAQAAFLQPIILDALPVGVLVAYWQRTLESLPERTIALFGLFAVQAATAIERAHLLGRLELLARTDALTGAANRRTLDEVLTVAVAEARRHGRPLSIVMLDLDHFKQYNDGRGHQAGDDLLRTAVATWRAALRPADTLARYGGEEFLAVLPATDAAAAILVADRLRAALPGDVTASAGAATWDGEESSDAFVARADAAMYEAKAGGRARTVASASPGPAV